ncbi:MAG: hypothetical protein QXW71_02285 [Thermoplasmata archaeon]
MEIWAKSNGETLKEHTEKVKASIINLFEKIYTFYLPKDGLLYEIVSDEKRKDEFLKLLKLVATYHNIGKISPEFQKILFIIRILKIFRNFQMSLIRFFHLLFSTKKKLRGSKILLIFCNVKTVNF